MTSLLASHHQVWVGTDEWTDTQGHAIVNILLGCSDKVFFLLKCLPFHTLLAQVYVTGTVQLQCKGPSLGVEHSELAQAVLDNLTTMGVQLTNVIAFVSDSAAVLKKAHEDVLKRLMPHAPWRPCSSHLLNNVAKVAWHSTMQMRCLLPPHRL